MKLENRLRESLGRRAGGVRGDPDHAWTSINERLDRRGSDPVVRRVGVAAVALAVASAGVFVALRAFLGGPPIAPDRQEPSSSRYVRPHVVATVPVGDFPRDVAVGAESVWATVADGDRRLLVTIDSRSNEVVGIHPLRRDLEALVEYEGSVWGVTFEDREPTLLRLDDQGRTIVGVDGLGGPLALDGESLWAVRRGPEEASDLVRLDPTTGRILDSTPLGESAWFLAAGDGAVWVLTLEGGVDLLRIDAETGEVTGRIDVPISGSVGPPLAAEGSLWVPVARPSGSLIVRLDGTTGELVGEPIPATVAAGTPVGASAGGVWFLGDRPGGQTLARLDLESLAFDRPLLLDQASARTSIVHAAELSLDGATIWIANHRDSVTRVDLVAGALPPSSQQPGVGVAPTPPPDRWCNSEGECASLERYEGEERPYERPGAEHCDWESATFIAFRGGQYVRDERGDVVSQADVTYEASASLLQDAEPTGWHRGTVELWLSPSEFDSRAGVFRNIYLVHPSRIERLPHFPLGCV